MRFFDWLTSVRRPRSVARRNIRTRQPEYQQWSGRIAQIEIMEDRCVLTPSVWISGPGSEVEPDSGATGAWFVVNLTELSATTVTVPWTVTFTGTGSGYADAGDFGALSGSGPAQGLRTLG